MPQQQQHTLLEADECLSNSRVQGNHCTGAVGLRTYGTELKAVACEGEWRGAVTIGVIDQQFRNLRDIHLQTLLASHGEDVIYIGLLDMIEEFAHLLTQERADDGRRCLVGAQTMGVGGTHDRGLQQTVVLIDTHQGLNDEGSEAQVSLRRLTRGVQQDAVVSAQRPVVVLTRTVDACEGLFVQQHTETVLTSHLLHH